MGIHSNTWAYMVIHGYYKTARADNSGEKVTQQWHDRDQTESLNATVDSCFAVLAARQHSVATSSSD